MSIDEYSNTQYRNQESKKESEHFLPVKARNPVSSCEEKYYIGSIKDISGNIEVLYLSSQFSYF